MGVLRLAICVSGVYATFLLWAIAQERLSKPFPRSYGTQRGGDGDKFPSPIFLNFAQSLASGLSAVLYLLIKSWSSGDLRAKGWRTVLGIDSLKLASEDNKNARINGENGAANGNGNGHVNGSAKGDARTLRKRASKAALQDAKQNGEANGTHRQEAVKTAKGRTLRSLLFQVSLCQTLAGPIGFLALRHISFPTMVLGKSCKLIPVMLLNVLLYRRRFSGHKYIVVGLVTVGISLFMLLAPRKKKGGSDSLWGMTLLLINLMIDGMTNSTQDQIFSQYPSYTGQQMMAHMAFLSQMLLLPALLLPLPSHPWTLLNYLPPPFSGSMSLRIPPSLQLSPPAILTSLQFLGSHPSAVSPLLAYALLGGLGQLFIFETIQHFGSLTLVMVTVTRKLFTMLLSVIVFEHKLAMGQWAGVAVVFAGIGVEAGMKRRDMMRKTRRDKGK